MITQGEPLRILMADDSDEDVALVQHALKVNNFPGRLHRVCDGQEAVDYLQARPPFQDRVQNPFPNTILTDLKMPRMDGFGLLTWLRSHPNCAVIPAIVYSSSFLEPDVKTAYQLGANAFISKPHNLEDLIRIIRLTNDFWSLCLRPSPPVGDRC